MIVTMLLDLLLALALVLVACLTYVKGEGVGPETGAGLGPFIVVLLLVLGLVLVGCILRGRFDWIPGGRFAAFALMLGVLTGFGVASALSLEPSKAWWSYLPVVVPYLVLACCLWAIHGMESIIPVRTARISVAWILGTVALAGWGVVIGGAGMSIWEAIQEADKKAAAARARDEEQQAYDLTQFRALASGATLWQLLVYVNSTNEAVRKECRERIAQRPTLDDDLIELLGGERGEEAAYYIAERYATPSAKLALAYASFLEQAIEGWKTRLDGAPHPVIWEGNIRPFFEAARKIQMAGADLRPQLRPWHDFLQTVQGMNGLAEQIQRLIDER